MSRPDIVFNCYWYSEERSILPPRTARVKKIFFRSAGGAERVLGRNREKCVERWIMPLDAPQK
jgi:hypothetical protein